MIPFQRIRIILLLCVSFSLYAVAQNPGDYSDFAAFRGVQQVHIAQGSDPTSMTISWYTPNVTAPGLNRVCYQTLAFPFPFSLIAIPYWALIFIVSYLDMLSGKIRLFSRQTHVYRHLWWYGAIQFQWKSTYYVSIFVHIIAEIHNSNLSLPINFPIIKGTLSSKYFYFNTSKKNNNNNKIRNRNVTLVLNIDRGWIHHVKLTNLRPGKKYYYLCGDEETSDGANGVRSFRTLPAVGELHTSIPI